ncbi:hypothetical protein DFAR_2090033 [Desulfarculales bacterium]
MTTKRRNNADRRGPRRGKRFEYAIHLGALALVTGDVGSGKSTALRWTASRPHPSEYQIIWVTASQSSSLELYRQFCVEHADFRKVGHAFHLKRAT